MLKKSITIFSDILLIFILISVVTVSFLFAKGTFKIDTNASDNLHFLLLFTLIIINIGILFFLKKKSILIAIFIQILGFIFNAGQHYFDFWSLFFDIRFTQNAIVPLAILFYSFIIVPSLVVIIYKLTIDIINIKKESH